MFKSSVALEHVLLEKLTSTVAFHQKHCEIVKINGITLKQKTCLCFVDQVRNKSFSFFLC